MHPAKVIALALDARETVPRLHPERLYRDRPARVNRAAAALTAGAGLALALAAWRMARGRMRS